VLGVDELFVGCCARAAGHPLKQRASIAVTV
jgi:hypothetical protein